MASVASQLIAKETAHAQNDSLEDAREICADGTYFPNNLRIFLIISRSVLPSMRNVSEKFVDNIKTQILCSLTFSRNFCHL